MVPTTTPTVAYLSNEVTTKGPVEGVWIGTLDDFVEDGSIIPIFQKYIHLRAHTNFCNNRNEGK